MSMRVRSLRALCLSAAVVAAAVAAPAILSAQGGVGITIFENPNYQGRNATFRDEVTDLSDYHLNDRVSSFRIARGETWEVCQDKDFGGRCAVFSGDEPDLKRVSWDETITSLRPVRRGDGRGDDRRDGRERRRSTLVLFEDRDLRGRSHELDRPDRLLEIGNRVSSLSTRGGSWEICERPDFGGRCVVVAGEVPDLRAYRMRNGIASARPVRGEGRDAHDSGYVPPPPDPPRLILYEQPNFRGRAREVDSDDSEISDFNDRAKSARAVSGAWQICEHKNFGGRCVTIRGDVPDLGAYRLSSAVTSARPVFEDRR